MPNAKRILRVTIHHQNDDSSDTSWMGAFSNAEQAYVRMMEYERGDFTFIGIYAKAEITLGGECCQDIRSGGLWRIESDSGKEYLAEVGTDELAQLKQQLHAIGFGTRAISAAFKNVVRPR